MQRYGQNNRARQSLLLAQKLQLYTELAHPPCPASFSIKPLVDACYVADRKFSNTED